MNDDPTGVDIEMSDDEGATWRPLRPGFSQGGTIERVDGDIAVQSIGRGKYVWYRVRERKREPKVSSPER